MLIIEGADMVGKTTLCDYLAAELPECARMKVGIEAKRWDLGDYMDRVKPNTIADRFHLSEIAYGSTCRGRTNLCAADCEDLDKAIHRVGGLVVFIDATPAAYEDVLLMRYDAAREEFSRELCKSAHARYRELSVGWNGYALRFDHRWTLDFESMDLARIRHPTPAWAKHIASCYRWRQADYINREARRS